MFVVAFLLKGYEPVVLTMKTDWTERLYRLIGVKRFVHLQAYLNGVHDSVSSPMVDEFLSRASSFEKLMAFEFEGVKIGKYICSSLVRKTYTGSVDVLDPEVRSRIKEFLKQTMETTRAAAKILDDCRPDTVLFLERGYTPFGEFFDLSLARGLDVLQWCGSHDDNAFILKRYHPGNATQHPASLSQKTWDQLKAAPWDSGKAEMVKKEIYKNYAAGKWFSEVGTQFNTKMFERNEILKQLELDDRKKTAVVFAHLFWDATFFYGKDLFQDYQEWFIESVRAACKNTNLNWILKLHPANIVKLNRDGYTGELVEKIAIQKSIGTLPPHVKILESKTDISTYSLFSLMDYCLTVRGTIGIESALFGKTVLTAGTGRYDAHGFTVDSTSREDYLDKLSRLQTIPAPTADQTLLAEKFAYGTFLLRPFRPTTVRVAYRNDSHATQSVGVSFRDRDELLKARDIASFGSWAADSKDEDYLNDDLLAPSILGGAAQAVPVR